MKTTTLSLRWLFLPALIFSATAGWAQTSQTPTQDVCPGTEPYLVTPGNVDNTFLWSISPGTAGVDWTITSPTTPSTNVIWTNPTLPVTYTLILTETSSNNCVTLVSVDVTVMPRPEAPISGGNQLACAETPLQTLTATATVPAGSTVVWYTEAIGGTVVASPTLNTVGTVTYYAETVTTGIDCGSVTRTAVTLTIEALPNTSLIFHN